MSEPTEFSVHDQDDYERVYDEDDMIEIRRGDLRALLDLATSSMDFGSGFWDNEQTEIARNAAEVLGIDPAVVTPAGEMTRVYVCMGGKGHMWKYHRALPARFISQQPGIVPGYSMPARDEYWTCIRCHHHSTTKPDDA